MSIAAFAPVYAYSKHDDKGRGLRIRSKAAVAARSSPERRWSHPALRERRGEQGAASAIVRAMAGVDRPMTLPMVHSNHSHYFLVSTTVRRTRLSIDIIDLKDAPLYRNPGKASLQILCPENSPEAQVTITRVTMAPGAVSGIHSHDGSEQIWIIEQGQGTLLLADGLSTIIKENCVVRTPPGTEHGLINTGEVGLIYLSITTPPEDMTKFYQDH